MSNDSDNVLTIMTQQLRIDELETENDNLRTLAGKAPDAGMIEFIAAFELWIAEITASKDDASIHGETYYLAQSDMINGVLDKFNNLKAQHIGSAEQETE